MLDVVSGAIREAVNWDVDEVVDATYTKLAPGRRPAVVLPVRNLTAVSSVVADDRPSL